MDEGGLNRALELFQKGMAVNAVAAEMGITWWDAKKCQRKLIASGQLQEAAAETKQPRSKARAPKQKKAKVLKVLAEDEEEPEIPDAFDLGLRLATDRMDAIFGEFTPQEKADAIATVLQTRLDALVA